MSKGLPAPATSEPADSKRLLSGAVSIVCLVALGVAVLFSPATLPSFQICWFARLTGLPCPGCGLTRSVCAIAHGHLAEAWHLHPFGYLFFVLFLVGAAGPLISRVAPSLEKRLLKSWIAVVFPAILVAGLVIFGVCRIVCSLL